MKPNPRVEQLEREVAVLRATIKAMQADPGDIPFKGCGDHSCIACEGPGGMGTNGGCRCSYDRLRQAAIWWRRVAQFRQCTVQGLRMSTAALEAADELALGLRLLPSVPDHVRAALDVFTEVRGGS